MSVFGFMNNDESSENVPTEIEQVVVTDRDDNEVVVTADRKAFEIAKNLAEKQNALAALEAENDTKVKRFTTLTLTCTTTATRSVR
jgi:hypothetical protein